MASGTRPGKVRGLGTCGGIGCVVLLILAGLVLYRVATDPFDVRSRPDLAKVKKMLPIKLPPSAELLNSDMASWLDTDIRAKLTVDKKDLPAVLKSIPKSYQTSSRNRFGLTNEADDSRWWDPDSISRFVAAYEDCPTKDYQAESKLLISTDGSERATIYYYYSGG